MWIIRHTTGLPAGALSKVARRRLHGTAYFFTCTVAVWDGQQSRPPRLPSTAALFVGFLTLLLGLGLRLRLRLLLCRWPALLLLRQVMPDAGHLKQGSPAVWRPDGTGYL